MYIVAAFFASERFCHGSRAIPVTSRTLSGASQSSATLRQPRAVDALALSGSASFASEALPPPLPSTNVATTPVTALAFLLFRHYLGLYSSCSSA